MVRDLLRGFVHQPWTEELDLASLESLPEDLLSGDLPGEYEERKVDRVWRVRLKDRDVLIVVILELQSSVDHDMALRLVVYATLLYQRLRRQGFVKAREPLPIVFPAVFYNGDRPWTAPLDLAELIHPPPGGLRAYRPSMRYLLIDEKRSALDDLAPNNVVSGIIRAEQAKDHVQLDKAVRCFEAAVPERPENMALRRHLLAWLSKVVLPSRIRDVQVPRLQNLYEFKTYVESNMHSWSDRWMEQGMQQGIQQGHEEVLAALLKAKFGQGITETVGERLKRATSEQARRWAGRILHAESLDEVFAEVDDEGAETGSPGVNGT